MEQQRDAVLGYKRSIRPRRGTPRRRMPARPVLSAIDIIPHTPLSDELFNRTHLSGQAMEHDRAARYRYQVEKAATNRKSFEETYEKPLQALDPEWLARYQIARTAVKEALAVPPSPHEVESCRFRTITIEECLEQVCVDQKEYMSIWNNLDYWVAEPLTIGTGEFPTFSISDCVDEGNGYSLSDGWLWVGASIRMSQRATVKEFGVEFSGYVWADPDGEDHLIYSDEWGRVVVESEFELRSRSPSGTYTHLVPPGQTDEEFDEKNSSGPTAAKTVDLSRNKVQLDLTVEEGHEFLLDYTLFWDVSRSPGDYWSSACFSLNKLRIKPYIVYESCHTEYREVARFFNQLLRRLLRIW